MLHNIISAIGSYIEWVWNKNILLHEWCYSFDLTENQTIGIGLGIAIVSRILQMFQDDSLAEDDRIVTTGRTILPLALGLNIAMYCSDFKLYSEVGSIAGFFAWFFILFLSLFLFADLLFYIQSLLKGSILHILLHTSLLGLFFISATILARFAAYALPFFLIVGGLLSRSGRSHVGTFSDGSGNSWDIFK